ncbi:VWA domain-containing protein [Niallia sp. NCCP-28]|uniref:VWA domain-containing protein n=1 Tax=Niallia sp. NCCP-28 TaxID=2934712 RepID=UPI00208AE24F|nr:VWA domain-containing protein [Niallia sp. NCCP-28]GKU84872.1 hypothetical protein NCCP28_42680 [Niallia sp. NCCP-28]
MKIIAAKWLCFAAAAIVLASCSSQEPSTANTDEKSTSEAAEQEETAAEEKQIESTTEPNQQPQIPFSSNKQALPQTLEEMVHYPVGALAGEETSFADEAVQNTLRAIPVYSENASEDELNELLYFVYSLYKKEYEDPKVIIDFLSIASSPDSDALPKEQKTDTFNVEIILDSSGSMANTIGSKTRMELAKEAIKEFASSLPKESNIALRVYGHKGTGSDADKKMSCQANELVYDIQSYDEGKLNASLNKFQPAGWTPVADSLLEAKKDLSKYAGDDNQNIIYLVSDGIETCGKDPVAAAKEIKTSELSPIVNIIGFDVDNEGQAQLQAVAEAAGGTYANVQNQEQLKGEFNKTVGSSLKWLAWKNSQHLDALSQNYSQLIDIYQFSNRWTRQSRQEQLIIQKSLQSLTNKKQITYEQYKVLVKKIDAFYTNQIKQITALQKELLNQREDNLKEHLEEVEKIYDANVNES